MYGDMNTGRTTEKSRWVPDGCIKFIAFSKVTIPSGLSQPSVNWEEGILCLGSESSG
jgi:hypothetical protein